jgi:citrate lyase subunit beta / citryl-CoA lyase
MLFVPGIRDEMLIKCRHYKTDSLIFDLEDSVKNDLKNEAREKVCKALATNEFGQKERVVRVNGFDTPLWKDDVKAVIEAGVDTIIMPKIDSKHILADAIKLIDIWDYKKNVGVIPLIESAYGVIRVNEIVSCGERITALMFGAGDYLLGLGCAHDTTGDVLIYPRSRIALAAASTCIAAIDTPYFDFNNDSGLEIESFMAKNIGFSGKAAIHPKQLDIINRVFSPSKEEVALAREIMENYQNIKHTGAIVFKGKLIEKQVVERYKHLLDIADFDEKSIK